MSKSSIELITEAEEKAKILLSENAEKLRALKEKASRDAEKRIDDAYIASERLVAAGEKTAKEKADAVISDACEKAEEEARLLVAEAEKNMNRAVETVIRGIFIQ